MGEIIRKGKFMAIDFTTELKMDIKKNTTGVSKNKESIVSLEKADIKLSGSVENVCEKVGNLTKVLWWLVTTFTGAMIVFMLGAILDFFDII